MTEDFVLKKVKIDGKNVELSYHTPDLSIGTATKDKIDVTSDRTPHPDLTKAIKALEPWLAQSNSLSVHRQEMKMNAAQKKAWEKCSDILEMIDSNVLNSVEVSGISLSGDEKNRSVVITGNHKTGNTATAMNSPNIKLNGDTWGFEAGLKDAIDEIYLEARAYVLEKKSSQLQMAFDEQKEEETAEAV